MATQPLVLLREFTLRKKPIILKDASNAVVDSIDKAETVVFDTHSFPRQASTHFKKSASNSETYTLDTLIFLTQHAHLDNSAYFKECQAHNIDHVSIVDKKKIMDYLTGKVDTLPIHEDQSKTEPVASGKRSREEQTATEADAGADADVNAELTKAAPSSKKAKASAQETDEVLKWVCLRERELHTRNTVLQGTKSFEKVIAIAQKAMMNKNTSNGSASAGAKPTSSHSSSQRGSSKDKIPLMIVSAAPTAKFTLYNIKQFLENSNYVDPQELRAQGIKKPERVTIEHRRRDGQMVVYHVVDSVANFKQHDWDRVACVFASGHTWQFNGWKYEKPTELFSRVKGFYAKWSDEQITGPAAKWNVTPINLHRHRRHTDKANAMQFWEKMDGR